MMPNEHTLSRFRERVGVRAVDSLRALIRLRHLLPQAEKALLLCAK